MVVANTLAYHNTATIMAENSFIVQTPRANIENFKQTNWPNKLECLSLMFTFNLVLCLLARLGDHY
jgi:hypothetical protein